MSEPDLTAEYNAAVRKWNTAKDAVKSAEVDLARAQLREWDTYRALDEASKAIDAFCKAKEKNG